MKNNKKIKANHPWKRALLPGGRKYQHYDPNDVINVIDGMSDMDCLPIMSDEQIIAEFKEKIDHEVY